MNRGWLFDLWVVKRRITHIPDRTVTKLQHLAAQEYWLTCASVLDGWTPELRAGFEEPSALMCSLCAGSSIVNVAPLPSVLMAWTAPLCASTSGKYLKGIVTVGDRVVLV